MCETKYGGVPPFCGHEWNYTQNTQEANRLCHLQNDLMAILTCMFSFFSAKNA